MEVAIIGKSASRKLSQRLAPPLPTEGVSQKCLPGAVEQTCHRLAIKTQCFWAVFAVSTMRKS